MKVPAKLAAFAVTLVVIFAGAFALGAAVGPIDGPDRPPAHQGGSHTGGSHIGGG